MTQTQHSAGAILAANKIFDSRNVKGFYGSHARIVEIINEETHAAEMQEFIECFAKLEIKEYTVKIGNDWMDMKSVFEKIQKAANELLKKGRG